MELTLKYNEHATHSLNAAFIRGNNPAIWLQEINAWQMPLTQLGCYIVSQNNNPVEAAGLFVIFNREHTPDNLLVKQPYTVMGGRLYIPIEAELSPAISEKELHSLLMWHCQVLHPALGFIGFEKKDQVELSALLQYTAPKAINWEYAQEGHTPWIPLYQINVQRLTAEEIFGDVKDVISSKPLPDIPKSNKRNVPPLLNNKIAGGLLKGAFALLSGLGAIASIPGGIIGGLGGLIPSSGNGGAVGRSSGSGKPGFMSRIMDWMQQKIEDLERERDSELKRLTDMFEKNVDEFLQYAIPLSSPYLNRGTANPGSRLTKNPFQFNFGRLGGGKAVDGWNLDKYHDDLRNKYLKAAQQAIDKRDYKKAAYVYAHLLGDYAMAASTLKQGKHYREAAVLYKDHLNNNRQAAECYEEGGLYVEAIELYGDLYDFEKVGDLYMELGQKEEALKWYEDSANKEINPDYLQRSRIIADKIGDRPRAKEVLLQGWQDVKQPEECLTKYFDMLADDNKAQLHDEVKNFYAKGELKNKKLSFLNVIDEINKKHKTSELENTCRNIAYEVVSEEVSAGNKASLHQLKGFIANDQLLTPDCYRFIHTIKDMAVQKPVSNEVLLVKDVLWKKAMTWQNQMLTWGTKPTGFVLARISSEGHVEYASWPIRSEMEECFVPLADPKHTNNIVLYTEGMNTADKILVQNKYFQDQLRVFQPQFLHTNVVGIGMYDGDLITLHYEHEEAFLNTYSLAGELKLSVRCSFKEQGYRVPVAITNELIRCSDFYYLACDNMVLRISDSGEIEVLFYLQGLIRKLVVQYIQYGLTAIGFYSGSRAFFMTNADDYKSDPFEVSEDGLIINDIAMLPNNKFAVATEKNVKLFYGVEEGSSPELFCQYNIAGVAAVFQGVERNQLGIMEKNGKISFHVIN
jgi:tetratricopeptide (TPR) repeat protein